MDLSTPAAAVLPSLRARVLMVLARADAGLTGRRVAGLAEGSVAGVAKALEALVAGGLVHRIHAGSASLYTLNREHVAAPAVDVLAGLRDEMIARIRASIANFTHRPVSAYLFGSAARGDGSGDSDIDVLLVRPSGVDSDDEEWASDVDHLGSLILLWTGNPLNAVEYGRSEVDTGSSRRLALFSRIESEGLLLHGNELRQLRRRRQAVGRAL